MQYEEIVALLPDYLNGQLTDKENQGIHDALQQSKELREALTSIKQLQTSVNQWCDEETPDWHRTAFAARVQQKHSQWFNWFSLATSMAAVLLVMFRVQVISNDDGLQISFGDQFNNATIQRQLNEHLDSWQEEQVAYLDHRFLEFENKQLVQSQQILTAALRYNRDERRQDLTQLTSYLVGQRSKDIRREKNRYQQIANNQQQDREDIKSLYASLKK